MRALVFIGQYTYATDDYVIGGAIDEMVAENVDQETYDEMVLKIKQSVDPDVEGGSELTWKEVWLEIPYDKISKAFETPVIEAE